MIGAVTLSFILAALQVAQWLRDFFDGPSASDMVIRQSGERQQEMINSAWRPILTAFRNLAAIGAYSLFIAAAVAVTVLLVRYAVARWRR